GRARADARGARGGPLRRELPARSGDAALRCARRAGVDRYRLLGPSRAVGAQALQLRRDRRLAARLPRAAPRWRAVVPARLALGVGAEPRRGARLRREPLPLPARLLPAPLESR